MNAVAIRLGNRPAGRDKSATRAETYQLGDVKHQ